MVDNNNQYIPMVHIVDRNKRRERLASRLEVCADRICDLQDRLMAGITALRPIEYDRLLDEYRAELVRYDNIDRELRQLEDPTKTEEYRAYYRNASKQQKNKINYFINPIKRARIMARTKKTVVSGISREQAEQAFADFAAADAKVQNLTSKMDLEMTRIREKYADQLAELSATKEKNFDIMQAYAVENKEELFSRKKSLESAHGVFGFRTGTPKLKNLKGFTWAAVTNLCKELLPQYIRTSEELAKDRLLADRENPDVVSYFPKIGVQVVQEETFYVEPKKESDAVEQ